MLLIGLGIGQPDFNNEFLKDSMVLKFCILQTSLLLSNTAYWEKEYSKASVAL